MRITSVTVRPWQRDRYGRTKQTRTRVYMNPKGETILENLFNRHSRPTKLYRSVLPGLKEYLCANYRADPRATFRWSQKAGCSCGCSPGFKLDDAVRDHDFNGCDVFVTVE